MKCDQPVAMLVLGAVCLGVLAVYALFGWAT